MAQNTHDFDESTDQETQIVTSEHRVGAHSRGGRLWQRFQLTSMPMQALTFAAIFGLLGGGVLLVKDYALTPECINQNISETKDISLPAVQSCLLHSGLFKVALANGVTTQVHGGDPIMPTQITQTPVTANDNGVLVQATEDLNPVTPTIQPTDVITLAGANAQARTKAVVAQVKNLTSHLLTAKDSNTPAAASKAVTPGATATNVTAASTDPSLITTNPLAPYCATDYYGQLIYAVPAGTAQSSSGPGSLLTAFEQANGFLHDQAAPFHMDMRYKMLCSGGKPVVTVVHLPNSNPNFAQTTSELAALGYNRPNVKYWVYVQGRGGSDFSSVCGGNGNCFFGMGTAYEDDSLSVNNASNGYYPEWGVVFNVPWNYAPSLLMHEDGHNQGAVQLSAPNSDHHLHCSVSYAVMCYGGTQHYNCQTEAFDCGDNNYFNPAPASNNYLHSHWNIGSPLNHFVARSAPHIPSPALDLILTQNTSSGNVEIHQLSAASDYQTANIANVTHFALSSAANGSFQMVGNDLYYIQTANTSSGYVQVHTATAASGYQSGSDYDTPFSTGLAKSGSFQMVGSNLYFIQTANTGSGKVELHAVSGSSNYQTFILHVATFFTPSYTANGFFRIVGTSVPGANLAWISTQNTGSGKVELHIVTAASGYQTFSLHTATVFTYGTAASGYFSVGDANNDGSPDLGYIHTSGTGSGQVEVFYAYSNSYTSLGYAKASSFPESLGPLGTWQLNW